MKYHWKTPDMIAALQAACPGRVIHNNGPGGDFDTDTLLVEVHNHKTHIDGIYVTGFHPETPCETPADYSDAEITHVTLGDGRDSSGGLTSDDPDMADVYCSLRKALAALLKGTGVSVHNHYDEFF